MPAAGRPLPDRQRESAITPALPCPWPVLATLYGGRRRARHAVHERTPDRWLGAEYHVGVDDQFPGPDHVFSAVAILRRTPVSPPRSSTRFMMGPRHRHGRRVRRPGPGPLHVFWGDVDPDASRSASGVFSPITRPSNFPVHDGGRRPLVFTSERRRPGGRYTFNLLKITG
jgi:hypothetical protein